MKSDEFITSDTHFGHKSICAFANRPFTDVYHMNESMIAAWNAKVPPGAVVYHLGDLSFMSKPKTISLVKHRLNGRIRLVLGNHDKRAIRGELFNLFDWVRDYYESRTEDGRKIVMCHYPMLTWNGAHRGAWMLHGHSHQNIIDTGTTRFDVGVDGSPNYAPYSFRDIEKIMSPRTYGVVDHHGSRASQTKDLA